MSNVESDPVEVRCAEPPPTPATRTAVEVITAREVPLGGPRAMTVRRTLPQSQRSLIGAWCFADYYGPDRVADSGLQTVSWLFTGEIEHRDSLGKHALVRPGELNLMTGGRGICHSEVSTPATTVPHGVQLWVALPDAYRDAERDFVHSAPEPVDARMEHGLLVDAGPVRLRGTEPTPNGLTPTELSPGELGYLRPGQSSLSIENPTGEPARMILLGGEPFGEEIVMWWNFVGCTHEDVVAARAEWEAQSNRFGHVEGYVPPRSGAHLRLPAPPLPNARMTPRRTPE